MKKESDEIDEIVKEKLTKGTVDFLRVDSYEVSFDARNWIVSKKKDSSDNTYHTTLTGALMNLSTRLLKDRLKGESKEHILDLKELIRVVDEHHEYVIGLVRGL